MRRVLYLILVWLVGAVWAQQPPCYDLDCTHNLPYTTVNGTDLTVDLFRPLGADITTPVVLAVPGETGGSRELRPLAEWLAMRGVAVVVMTGRAIPPAQYPAPLEDIRAALGWVAQHAETYQFDMRRLSLLGMSIGGHLAAMAAVQPTEGAPKIAGVITVAAPLDFTTVPRRAKSMVTQYLGTDTGQYAMASPAQQVTATSPPFLLVYGTDDPYIPVGQAEGMAKVLHDVKVSATLCKVARMAHALPAPGTEQGRVICAGILGFVMGERK